jgi:acyl-CoA thioesterase-1
MRSGWRALVLGAAALGLAACNGGSSGPPPPAEPTQSATARPALGVAARPSPSAVSSPSPVASRGLNYVAIGASDTVGVGAADPATQGWVPRFARRLGPQTRVQNLGVSGTVIHAALDEQLPVAVRAQPDVVTVWLAVNDLNAGVQVQQYHSDLEIMLSTLARETHAAVLVANVPDLTLVPKYRDQDTRELHDAIESWNTAIDNAARRNRAHVVDLFAEYAELAANPGYLSDDGFHPSSAGYARIADLFADEARSLLPQGTN